MSSKKEFFIKNTAIIFISQFISQVSNFLLIPIMTNILSSEEYGEIDLIQVYISLFTPIIILRLDSAFFRFLVEKRDTKRDTEEIISNGLLFLLFSAVFAIVLSTLIFSLYPSKYAIWIVINIISMMIATCMMQILRGIGSITDFAFISIFTAILNVLINIIFMYQLKIGAVSALISSSISNLCVSIYSIYRVIYRQKISIRKKKYNSKVVKEMLKYSLPMVPDYLSGWIINVSDRSIISLFLGLHFSGTYSVSSKISNALNSVFVIYNTSWHEMAILWAKDKDRDKIFSRIINESVFFSQYWAYYFCQPYP